MAVTVDELRAVMRMEMKPFMRDLQKMNGVSSKAARQVENTWRQANRRLDGIGKNMAQSLIAPMAGIGAALGTRELIRLTDTWTDLNSRVALAAGGMEEGADVMQRLGEVARRTYSSLEQTAEGYLLNSTAMRELGYSTSQTLDYTEAVNNALVISGAKGQRAEAVMNALSKAMAGGKLAGDNLNTVIEQGGRLAEALAAGLGVGVNQLRALGTQGKITGRDIVRSLSKEMETLRREAEEMPATISDGIQLLQNAMLQYVGNADSAAGVSAKISEALVIMADNFDKTADVALQLAAVIAGALVGRSLAKMISTLGLAGSALINFTRTLSAARTMAGLSMAFTGLGAAAGPVGMLIGGAVVSSLVMFSNTSAEASEGARRFADRLKEIQGRAEESATAVEQVGERYSEALKNALGHEVDAATDQLNEAKEAAVEMFDFLFRSADLSIISDDQLDELKNLRDGLDDGSVSAEEAKDELFALANSNPNFQALANAFGPVLDTLALVTQAFREARAEQAALAGAEFSGRGPASRGGAGNARRALEAKREEGRIYEEEQLRRARLGREQLALENEIARVKKQSADDGIALTDNQIKRIAEANLAGNASRSSEGRKPKQERADEYERLSERIAETTAALVAETEVQRGLNPLIDDYGYAVERARAEQDLLNAALAAGKEITPELRAQIGALADQFALATVEAAKLGETQDEIRQRTQEMRDLQKGLTHDIIDGFIQGKNAADIFSNALKKVGDHLLNDVLDNIFKIKNASGSGGIFGFLGSLFGMGGGISPLASSFISRGGVGLFAEGGYTGSGGKHQPKGVVHGGEYVFSKNAVSKIGVGNLEAMHRSLKGYAAGGFVAPAMPSLAGMRAGGETYSPQYNIDARGAEAGVETKIRQALQEYDKGSFQRWVSGFQQAKKRNVA